MKADFDTSLRALLQHEGGYVNNPKDPGGPTNKGITIGTARLYISPSFSIAQLKALTVEQAGIVYRKQYADKVMFDNLPAGLDYAAFDYAVNSGPGRPINVLRALVGQKVFKGNKIDDETLRRIAQRKVADLINALNDERLRFLKALKAWATFGKGWERRVREVRIFALRLLALAPSMASAGVAPPLSTPVEPAQGKAVQQAADQAAKPAAGTAGGLATATAAGATVANQAGFAIPWWGIVLIVLGVIVAAGVAAVFIIRRYENKVDDPAPGTNVVPAIGGAIGGMA